MSQSPITDAIAEQLVAQGTGGMVTGYILLAEYLDADGNPSWFISFPDEQRLSASIGQVEWLRAYLRRQADAYFTSDEDED